MAVCWDIISFEATTPWKKATGDQNNNKDIKTMIKEIISYQEKYNKLSEEEKTNIFSEELQAKFINHICVEEGVGLQEQSDTITLLREIQQNQISIGETSKKRRNTQLSRSEPSEKRRLTENKRTRIITRQFSRSEQETKNVSDAWLYLRKLSNDTTDRSISGLVEVDSCIKETHRILMKDVLGSENTPAGKFCTSIRKATYKGKTHIYPKFDTEGQAENAVLTIVDRYNALVDKIKVCEDPEDKLYKLFKCAAYLLFKLISVHPFSDGNGRLCRLLCSYVLSVMFPFPSSIYNVCSPTVKNDYVDGIVSARERDPSHPQELTGLMIESNWHVWKTYFEIEQKYETN